MEKFIHRGIGYIIRKLESFSEIGFDLKKIKYVNHLRKIGITYSRYRLFNKKWLLSSKVNTVIDIGANIGEFTSIFAELFPDSMVYAFEPLPDCFEELTKVTKQYQGRVKAFNIALGSQTGSFEFHKSSWAPASSFREMSELHKRNYPHSAGSDILTVPMQTLDNVFQDIVLEDNTLIKMDVQGFEDEVIKGGIEVIQRASILVIECSLQKTYEGEPMFNGIHDLLRQMGFEYRGSLKQSVRKDDDSFLQADCVFIMK